MGIQQLLLGGGPSFLTPEEAIQFFYDNTTLLMARDVNNVQSWVPRGRFNVSNDGNFGRWSFFDNALFDYTVGSLTGKAANSNYVTIVPIAYGNDDYANSPGGNTKSFGDLNVTLTSGGVVTAPMLDNPTAVVRDFGGGVGIFQVPETLKNIDSLTLDVSASSSDDYAIYHTALFPGRWRFNQTISANVLNGEGPFTMLRGGNVITYPVGSGTTRYETQVSKYSEFNIVIPPFGFAIIYHATDIAWFAHPSSSHYFYQSATFPTGTFVAYERRPLINERQYMDAMVVNTTSTNKTVVWRFPWEVSTINADPESGTLYEQLWEGYKFGAVHTFRPDTYFDVPDALGVPVGSGFLVAAENTSVGNPAITFTPTGSINKFAEAGDSTTNVWAAPSNPSNGSFYFIRFQQTSSSDGATTIVTGGALNSWIALTSSVSISRNMPSSGIETTSGTVQISTTASTVGLVSSGTYRLDAAYYASGGGGGGGGSVWVNAYLPSGIQAAEVVEGDELLLLSADYSGSVPGTVISTRRSTQKLVTLISETGIRLTVSDNTPLTLSNGIPIYSTDAVGVELPVQDENGFRWEKIVSVIEAGEGEVETIFCDNQCYAAGDVPGRYIWTHNMATSKF